MDSEEPILTIRSANLQFGDAFALHDVSLSLTSGETHVLLGAAGSGKTSLLKSVIGLTAVDSGSIQLFGHEVTQMREHDLYSLRARTGMLFQEGGLFDSLPVGENIEYPLLNQQAADARRIEAAEAESRVREALRFVELEHTFEKFPSELSGGMRRRVGIARAIVTNPPLVLYDSPTAGLDPITANTIMALIAKQRDIRQTASLIVTHRFQDGDIMAKFRYDRDHGDLVPLSAAEQESTRTNFIVMKEGAIVFSGSRGELEANTDDYVKRFIRHEG
jgi:phospholipid/cholesterol/gamma-HCH transport system ATP-binding protein